VALLDADDQGQSGCGDEVGLMSSKPLISISLPTWAVTVRIIWHDFTLHGTVFERASEPIQAR